MKETLCTIIKTKPIGQGKFGRVFGLQCGKLALKIQPMTTKAAENEYAARKELVTFKHPNLLKVYDIGMRRLQSNKFGLLTLMELCPFGDMLEYILKNKRMELPMWQRAHDGIRDAVLYLHSQGFVHGDIKPENIFMTIDSFKLGDFGATRRPKVPILCGTSSYLAPELLPEFLVGRKEAVDYQKCDIWSFGLTFFVAHVGHMFPANSEAWKATYKEYKDDIGRHAMEPYNVDDKVRDILKPTLYLDAASRTLTGNTA